MGRGARVPALLSVRADPLSTRPRARQSNRTIGAMPTLFAHPLQRTPMTAGSWPVVVPLDEGCPCVCVTDTALASLSPKLCGTRACFLPVFSSCAVAMDPYGPLSSMGGDTVELFCIRIHVCLSLYMAPSLIGLTRNA